MNMCNKTKYTNKNCFAIDGNGLPSTQVCFGLLKIFYEKKNKYVSLKFLRSQFATRKSDIDDICTQLVEADYIEENPHNPSEYRYKLDSENCQLQSNYEKYLLECEGSPGQVKSLSYSPSFTRV